MVIDSAESVIVVSLPQNIGSKLVEFSSCLGYLVSPPSCVKVRKLSANVFSMGNIYGINILSFMSPRQWMRSSVQWKS